ncbi:SET domain-containing protein [Hamiltosporidium magnivora]|uniref:[histone H3]-lysine(4) N-trimethyltransferase n=1 Tax=Hamiltosporidium magnivora TaxID=148818 RepID=A0A4Q9LHZ6_9MICR|nr:SET domain-containing protein [Hamiltosporidium magnivora]
MPRKNENHFLAIFLFNPTKYTTFPFKGIFKLYYFHKKNVKNNNIIHKTQNISSSVLQRNSNAFFIKFSKKMRNRLSNLVKLKMNFIKKYLRTKNLIFTHLNHQNTSRPSYYKTHVLGADLKNFLLFELKISYNLKCDYKLEIYNKNTKITNLRTLFNLNIYLNKSILKYMKNIREYKNLEKYKLEFFEDKVIFRFKNNPIFFKIFDGWFIYKDFLIFKNIVTKKEFNKIVNKNKIKIIKRFKMESKKYYNSEEDKAIIHNYNTNNILEMTKNSINATTEQIKIPLFLKYIDMKSFVHLYLKNSSIHGRGLFANQDIPPNTRIIEYIGELIGERMADKREKTYIENGITSIYLFRIEKDIIIDATMKGSLSRFINHSCLPNSFTKKVYENGISKIIIHSQIEIFKNEEITLNYNFSSDKSKTKTSCNCKSINCRKYL